MFGMISFDWLWLGIQDVSVSEKGRDMEEVLAL